MLTPPLRQRLSPGLCKFSGTRPVTPQMPAVSAKIHLNHIHRLLHLVCGGRKSLLLLQHALLPLAHLRQLTHLPCHRLLILTVPSRVPSPQPDTNKPCNTRNGDAHGEADAHAVAHVGRQVVALVRGEEVQGQRLHALLGPRPQQDRGLVLHRMDTEIVIDTGVRVVDTSRKPKALR